MKLIKKLLVLILLTTASVFGQTAEFSLQVEKSDETCPGNGSLSFEAVNTAQGASVLYKVYLLPDNTNPIAAQTNNYLGSLTAGTYTIVASQTTGAVTTTKQTNITIFDQTIDFNFNSVSANENCTGGGSIVINTTSGTAVSYEIISGPETRPLQSSNTFDNLPMGTYNVRVFDSCGFGKVKTHNLSYVISVLDISAAMYPDVSSPQCSTITLQHNIVAAEGIITYPLTVEQEFDAMDINGNPITNYQTFTTGPADVLTVSTVVPRGDDAYGYTMRVTNNCNVVHEKSGMVNPDIELKLSTGNSLCYGKYLIVDVSKFAAPYTLTFVSAPDDFNATQFQGTTSFSVPSVKYGNENNPVPFGEYVVKITDACGRTITEQLNIELELPEPEVVTYNEGCFAEIGTIRISIPEGNFVSARIISAPAAFNEALPFDATHRINAATGMFAIREIAIGAYVIEITDNCGFIYTVEAEIPPFVEKDFSVVTLPGCTDGYGTLHIKSRNGKITWVTMLEAPATYEHALPFDVSAYISDVEGDLFMNNLPAGNYTFKAIDQCGIQRTMNINLVGYRNDKRELKFTPYCGSYSMEVKDYNEVTHETTYWLQKYNPATGTWGHPVTGVPYEEGTEPTAVTGKKMINFRRINNLTAKGKYRIVKKI